MEKVKQLFVNMSKFCVCRRRERYSVSDSPSVDHRLGENVSLFVEKLRRG